jgi:hypothetical protein
MRDLPKFAGFQITQQPAVGLPSTRQIDARIQRQTHKLSAYIEDRLRLKDATGHGRRMRGPRRTKPPAFVHLWRYGAEDGYTLVCHRDPDRRHPHGTDWIVPCEGIHVLFHSV